MIIKSQITRGDYTALILDDNFPFTRWEKLLIDGKEYKPEPVYGTRDCVAIKAKGNFKGKEIRFI